MYEDFSPSYIVVINRQNDCAIKQLIAFLKKMSALLFHEYQDFQALLHTRSI